MEHFIEGVERRGAENETAKASRGENGMEVSPLYSWLHWADREPTEKDFGSLYWWQSCWWFWNACFALRSSQVSKNQRVKFDRAVGAWAVCSG